jgi:hypothetical protein
MRQPMSNEKTEYLVVEQLETAIEAGGVDIEIEIVQRGDGPLWAQLGAFTYFEDEPLKLSVEDVQAIHDLTGRVLVAMKGDADQKDQPDE